MQLFSYTQIILLLSLCLNVYFYSYFYFYNSKTSSAYLCPIKDQQSNSVVQELRKEDELSALYDVEKKPEQQRVHLERPLQSVNNRLDVQQHVLHISLSPLSGPPAYPSPSSLAGRHRLPYCSVKGFKTGHWAPLAAETSPPYNVTPVGTSPVPQSHNCSSSGNSNNITASTFQEEIWIPKDCNIYEPSAGEIREMLTDRTLLFLGDSLQENHYFQHSYTVWYNRIFGDCVFNLYDHYCPSANYTCKFQVAGAWNVGSIGPKLIEHSAKLKPKHDIIVVNTGVHWNDRKLLDDHLKNLTMAYDALRRSETPPPYIFWMNTHAQHFLASANGMYVPGTEITQCMKGIHSDPRDPPIFNEMTLPVIEGLGIPILHTFDAELDKGDQHLWMRNSHRDCTHWCTPGPVTRHWERVLLHHLVFTLLKKDWGPNGQRKDGSDEKWI